MRSGTITALTGIWGDAANDVFTVGAGTILHYDGTTWTPMNPGTILRLEGVWGSAANDVFAVGGVVLHYDGTSWTAMNTGTTKALNSVWGRSGTDVFAFGGTILHYDGASWTSTDPGEAQAFSGGGAWGDPTTDVFAVGSNGAILRYDAPHTMPSGTSAQLHAVWGNSANDVFAVGEGGTIVHFDGASWSLSGGGTGAGKLLAVWGNSATDVLAAGADTVHYDGASWADASSPPGVQHGLWGSSASDVFAVGGADFSGAGYAIYHYDGRSWTPMISGALAALQGIWGSSSKDVFAVSPANVFHYDGVSWTALVTGPIFINTVWGSSTTSVFAGGFGGVITHYDGTPGSWETAAGDAGAELYGMWGTSSTNVFAVGAGGAIFHHDGASWTPVVSGSTNDLGGVWGTSAGVFAVGDHGTIVTFDATMPTANGGACPRPVPIYCESRTSSDTTAEPANVSGYGCASRPDTGPEVFYRLDSPISGQITLRLTPRVADLDLIAVGADGQGGCDPTSCLGASQNSGTTVEELTIPVTQSRTYYIIVDGYNGAASGYALELLCTKQ
jgi:hypothetical protein